MRLGDLLVHRGLVRAEAVEEALRQQAPGELLGQTLVRLGLVGEEDVLQALSEQLRIPIVDLSAEDVDASLLAGPAREVALAHQVVPLDRAHGVVRVALGDPFDTRAAEDLAAIYGTEVKPLLARPSQIARWLSERSAAAPGRPSGGGGEAPADAARRLREECEAERRAAEELAGVAVRARATGDAAGLVAAAEVFGAEAAARMERCLRAAAALEKNLLPDPTRDKAC